MNITTRNTVAKVAAACFVSGAGYLVWMYGRKRGFFMDTTTRLLGGGNRARTLKALESYRRGEFVRYNPAS